MQKGQVYNYRLSGNIQNLLLVGAVSVLRDKPKLRFIASTGGLALLVLGSFSYILIFDAFLSHLSFPMLFAGFGLLLVSTLARPEFNIYIGDPVEVQERREAEAHEGDSKDPYAALDLASKRLNEYYAINQSQARGSFRWAVFAMFCGLSTIVCGVWLFYFGDEKNAFLTSLSTAAGIIVNIVSSLYLYLHNKTQKRSLYYYNQLVRLQNIGLLVRIAEKNSDSKSRVTAMNKIISEVLAMTKLSYEKDVEAVNKE